MVEGGVNMVAGHDKREDEDFLFNYFLLSSSFNVDKCQI